MARGGRRNGAGRPHIDATDPLTIYCASEFEKIVAFDRDLMQDRLTRSVNTYLRSDRPHYEDLQEVYAKLRAVSPNKRLTLIAASGSDKPAAPGTLLDDARHIIKEELGGDRGVPEALPLSPKEVGYIYATIAERGFPVIVVEGNDGPQVQPNPRYVSS